MFTGIVEETGEVLAFQEGTKSYELTISASKALEEAEAGDSIAVNGCCLTVVEVGPDFLRFDLLGETVRLTSFQQLKPGEPVNLERSLRFNGKIGGHFVTGHIDDPGTVHQADYREKDLYLRIEPTADYLKWLVYKGSIAIDGVSLTVAEVDETGFAVWLIPHTLDKTNLDRRKPGDIVNLEFDLLAKYVDRLHPATELKN